MHRGPAMSRRHPVDPAPGPLEEFAGSFDELFTRQSQRDSFRRYLGGLLLSAERNKTLTGLANTEPVKGATAPRAQHLQWFLSESTWSPDRVNDRRLELLRRDAATAPDAYGALVIDETGDRKWGTKTAHVGRQYLGSLGKIDQGVVSVSGLWADERLYFPVEVIPYTPASWFDKDKADEAFRRKPAIALELVEHALAQDLPFRAVVADTFYGEHHEFKRGLERLGVGYVLALKPSHTWWHREGRIGSVEEVARAARWSPKKPGHWIPLSRTFRDGHQERWWALEGICSGYGPERPRRLVIVTTDPARLPDLTTWYLVTNLPAPDTERAQARSMPPADVADVVRLYGLRVWVEQSYKQVKATLGWAEYQVRSDIAIRRHWQLVFCAFSFCWWALSHAWQLDNAILVELSTPPTTVEATMTPAAPEGTAAGGKTWQSRFAGAASGELARSPAPGTGVVGALPATMALLARVVAAAPAGVAAGTA